MKMDVNYCIITWYIGRFKERLDDTGIFKFNDLSGVATFHG